MSDDTHFDLVVIGGGPAGYAAGLYAGSAGLSVGLVERDKVGGTCLHRGCIPAKELLETAAVRRAILHAGEYGIDATEHGIDFGVTQARKQKVVDSLAAGVTGLLKRRKVRTFPGTGRLRADGTVTVSGDDGEVSLSGDAVLLAAGSVPRTLPGFDVDGEIVLTSDEVLELRTIPERAVVVGGGAIGCEFASMMADLGSAVTILEALDQIVPGVDIDISKALTRSFANRGIEVRTGIRLSGHTPRSGGGTTVHLESGDDLDVDVVVMSVGRRPYADLLGLEETDVKVDDRGYVAVDEYMQTSVPGVYALGDLVATPQLAHVGFAEAILVVQHLLGESPVPIDYSKVPWAIYCHPEVAFAGLTEEQARAAGHDLVVSKHRFAGNSRAQILGETDGMVKIIAEKTPEGTGGRLLGVHMMGPWVTEQLSGGYLALNWEATVDEVAAFIQPHPTLSELFGESVLAMTGRSLHG